MDLNRLKDFFDEDDVDWKPIAVSKKTGKALAAAYVTNRAIMDRLDEVCGPENWKNEFRPGPGGGVVCGLSIRIGSEWVTKWDGSENTDVEAVKGGLSTSMRRAAVQWGLGRYIYRLPSQWIPVDQHKRFTQKPRVPVDFLPPRSTTPAAGETRGASAPSSSA
ncbi:MAG: Rad52/Rad22 family DNA repair protein, partial [Rhodothermales bacterium]